MWGSAEKCQVPPTGAWLVSGGRRLCWKYLGMETADVKSPPGWSNSIRTQICILELAKRFWSSLIFDLNVLVKSSDVAISSLTCCCEPASGWR